MPLKLKLLSILAVAASATAAASELSAADRERVLALARNPRVAAARRAPPTMGSFEMPQIPQGTLEQMFGETHKLAPLRDLQENVTLTNKDVSLEDTCAEANSIVEVRTGPHEIFQRAPLQCNCSASTPENAQEPEDYQAICLPGEAICMDYRERFVIMQARVGLVYPFERDAGYHVIQECAIYSQDDPKFANQVSCHIRNSENTACAILVGDQFCASCAPCSNGGTGLTYDCSNIPAVRSTWSRTSVSECFSFDQTIGTPFEYYHPTSDTCNFYDLDGDIAQVCVDEQVPLDQTPALQDERRVIAELRDGIADDDVCVDTAGRLRCSYDYEDFEESHNYQNICTDIGGQFFRSTLTVTCVSKATGDALVNFDIRDFPDCGGKSCNTVDLNVLAQLGLRSNIDYFEDLNANWECTGTYKIEEDIPPKASPVMPPVGAPTSTSAQNGSSSSATASFSAAVLFLAGAIIAA